MSTLLHRPLWLPIFALLMSALASAQAHEPLLQPQFTRAQHRVLDTAGRDAQLQSRLAGFLGITEARLLGHETGRINVLLAQFLVFQELSAENMPDEQMAWARSLLKSQDWGLKVFHPLAAQAQSLNTTVCPSATGSVLCYYFVLSRDMRLRLAARATLRDAPSEMK